MTNHPAPPAIIGGRYRVLSTLGRGGFGVVYLVEHINTGDRLALKVLYGAAARDPTSLERFKREARASSRVRSDNVVKIIDADAAPELDGAPYLVMELLDGQDLEHLIEARGPLPADEVVGLLAQVARALDKAHALGIIHRDLKPENLFLHRREDGSEVLKVLDFGIAKSLGDGAGDLRAAGMTGTGAVLGTPLFMAPEQARGLVGSISPATDVWAIGLIAFRMLTGAIYWRAEALTDLLVQIVMSEMPPPSSRSPLLPSAFDAWFYRSCDRDAALRFQSVGEQVLALAAALQSGAPNITAIDALPFAIAWPPSALSPGVGATAAGLTHTAAPPPPMRSRKPIGVVAMLGVLVVASAAALQLFGRGTPRPAASASVIPSSTVVAPVVLHSAATVGPPASASTIAASSSPPPAQSSIVGPMLNGTADKRQKKHPPPTPPLGNPSTPAAVAPPVAHRSDPDPSRRFDPDAP